jgi:hypothetical protein
MSRQSKKPTKRERQAAERQRILEERRRREQRAKVIRWTAIPVVILIGVGLFFVLKPKPSAKEPSGVKTYSVAGRNHVQGKVNYPQNPPVGGNHNPVWQNCGFYDAPVQNENAVHSMEHGAVWITYRPDLPSDQVAKLRDLAKQSYVLVTPYPGLPSPVVASAWGKQLTLNSANDPRLAQFVDFFRQGPQTPEPGAACTGGTGDPAT